MRCAAPGHVVPGPVTSAEAAGAHAAGGKTVTARPHSRDWHDLRQRRNVHGLVAGETARSPVPHETPRGLEKDGYRCLLFSPTPAPGPVISSGRPDRAPLPRAGRVVRSAILVPGAAPCNLQPPTGGRPLYPDVTNPRTSHWEGGAAVFDRPLSQSRPGACRRTGLACGRGSEGGDWKPAPRPGPRRRSSGIRDRPFSAVGHLGQENHTRLPSHNGVRRGRSVRGSVSSRDALTRQGKT